MRLALLAAALLATAAPARAQDVVLTGTLKDIAARGAIRLGVRTGAVPFSFRNRAGQSVAFSPVFFLAGTKLLAAPPVASWHDARSIAVSAGTTTDAVVQRVAASADPPVKVVETPDVPSAYALLVAGTVDAVASDDVLLSGLVTSTPEGHRFRVVGTSCPSSPTPCRSAATTRISRRWSGRASPAWRATAR